MLKHFYTLGLLIIIIILGAFAIVGLRLLIKFIYLFFLG